MKKISRILCKHKSFFAIGKIYTCTGRKNMDTFC